MNLLVFLLNPRFCSTPASTSSINVIDMFSMNNADRDSAASSPSATNRKLFTEELDLFSSKTTNNNHHVNYPVMDSSSVVIKKEKSQSEAHELDVNVSVNSYFMFVFLC